jgi:hypothetical protein
MIEKYPMKFILRFHVLCAKITPRGSREAFPHIPHTFHKG